MTPLEWPMAETPTHVMTMAFDPDLDDCVVIALRDMIKLICARTGISREDAYTLCSLAADLRVTQVVNGAKGIHVMLEKKLLAEGAVMSEAATLFGDGKAYERMMGRWSRLVGDVFLDWLALAEGLAVARCRLRQRRVHRGAHPARAPAEVTGIDPSKGSRLCAHAAGVKLAQFRTADAQELPFADAVSTSPHGAGDRFVPDPRQGGRRDERVVRPGGCVATYMWDIPGGGLPREPIHRAMHTMGWTASPASDASQAGQHADGLAAGRPRVVETRVIRIRVLFADFDDFWNRPSAPWVRPAGDQQAVAGRARRAQARCASNCRRVGG